jgi:hypothetical protein
MHAPAQPAGSAKQSPRRQTKLRLAERESEAQGIKGRVGDASRFTFWIRDAAFADPRRATEVGLHFEPSIPPSARAFRFSIGR